MTSTNEIWADDLLGRKAEAEMLQEVLVMEAGECGSPGREHAFVLALDAAYGEGKTFFLNKLRAHLGQQHPVAFVDAWVDDANDEPLLAIMSAINEALEPFLVPGGKAGTWLRKATTAALPIIGKVAVGAAKTFIKKHVGDEIPDQIDTVLKDNSKVKPGAEEEAILQGIDSTATEISSLADKMGAGMLAAYKARQLSKATFKVNMRRLVAAIDADKAELRQPLFVVIDELDRCRPDYAIKILEEVKHLFDIPGAVFIIAIHGDQLENSIKAVYGADFDAKAYLHRFFSRRYKLRRLTMRELIASRIAADQLDAINWNFPSLMGNGSAAAARNLTDLIAAFCTDYSVTPREFGSIADGLRMFGRTWREDVPIELVYLLGLLLRLVRALPNDAAIDITTHHTALHGGWDQGRSRGTNCQKLWRSYNNLKSTPLAEIATGNYRSSNEPFVIDAIESENNRRFGNRVERGVSSWLISYPERVARFGRMLEQA